MQELGVNLRLWILAAKKVIDQLDAYKGEEVIAFQHPLHDAVRELESVTRRNSRDYSGKMPFRLPKSMESVWFGILGYSRGPGGYPFRPDASLPKSWIPDNAGSRDGAQHCANLLRAMLSGAVDVLEIMYILVSEDENLPVPSYSELARRKSTHKS